jgi:Family of unknown function (DUF5317)
MIVVVFALAAGLLAGLVSGGSVRSFERVRVHWWGAALAGLALQIFPVHRWVDAAGVATAALVASYVVLIAFVWVNRRLPAAPLLLVGLALNAVVIAANDGMPVSEGAIRVAGGTAHELPAGLDDGKHHLMTASDSLTPLADVIGIPPPVATVLSIGDVFLYSGVAVFAALVMRGRSAENRRPRAWIPMYRGKHLPPQRRLPRRSRPEPGSRLAGASWGT